MRRSDRSGAAITISRFEAHAPTRSPRDRAGFQRIVSQVVKEGYGSGPAMLITA